MATSYQKAMSRTGSVTVAGGVAGGDLQAAAEIIADEARRNATVWSVTIPPRITVEVNGNVATIACNAPPAYPNEVKGVRHPVYARGPDRRHWTWVGNQYRPFLAPAADGKADAAMARYADKIDRMARAAGFK
jgi:hypothetical protein